MLEMIVAFIKKNALFVGLRFVAFMMHVSEMITSAGKVCVSMSADKVAEASAAFEFGRYEKFEPKFLKFLPYETFMISSESFKGFEPRFASVLFTAKVPSAGAERFGYVVAVKDDRLEIDSLSVSRDGRTLSGVSYAVPIDGRRSINSMAYDAVAVLKDALNLRKGKDLRALQNAVAEDLSTIVPCLAWLASANGNAVSAGTTAKTSAGTRGSGSQGIPGNPDVVLESELLPAQNAGANPTPKTSAKSGQKRKSSPKRPFTKRGFWRTYHRGEPNEFVGWVRSTTIHGNLLKTSNPVKKKA